MTDEKFPEPEREAGAVPPDVGGSAEERAEINRREPLAERLNPEGGEYVERGSHTPGAGDPLSGGPSAEEPTDHRL